MSDAYEYRVVIERPGVSGFYTYWAGYIEQVAELEFRNALKSYDDEPSAAVRLERRTVSDWESV